MTRRGRRRLFELRADESGATAIEFSLVALPFFAFVYGIILLGMYFFTTFSLENALERASRVIRTGEAQKANMTEVQFKNRVCSFLPTFISCENKLIVSVRSFSEADLTPPVTRDDCLTEGSLSDLTTYSPGTANQVVLVTLCYQWDFANKLPFINLSDMNGGARLIQAASIFRTEPYMD